MGSIEDVVTDFNIPEQFFSVILMSIVGNTCEHAGSLRFRCEPSLLCQLSCCGLVNSNCTPCCALCCGLWVDD